MTPTATMRPAELRTKIEALGITREFLADRAGVTVLIVFRNQRDDRPIDVSPGIVRALGELQIEFNTAAAAMALDAAGAGITTLPRYRTEEEWHHAVPELPGWPLSAQPHLLAEVQRRLGGRVGIEYA